MDESTVSLQPDQAVTKVFEPMKSAQDKLARLAKVLEPMGQLAHLADVFEPIRPSRSSSRMWPPPSSR